MTETEPAPPGPGGLTPADLATLGAEPLRRSDPVAIGPYQVLARLGAGGMGRLYLGQEAAGAAHVAAASLVAVKVVRPEYAEDAAFRRRFEREVEAVRRVRGTHTAGLLGSGFDDFDDEERLWMATSYVPGLSLEEAVRRAGPLPAPVVWRLAHEIGQALTAIAAAGIVHRDLKPSNVLLGPDGVRVIDFGVAHTADTSVLTMTGQQLGTPAFMSPEQAGGRTVATASDVFSLGSLLAFAVTGTAPFGEGTTGEVVHRVMYSPPGEAVLDGIAERDEALAALVGRCLEKDPDVRPGPDEVVDTARDRAAGAGWPPALAEVIEARAAWRSTVTPVSPMDRLTVLRRRPPERAPDRGNTGRRRPLLLLTAGAAAVGVAVLLAVALTRPDSSPAREASAVTAGHSSPPGSAHPSASGTTAAPGAVPTRPRTPGTQPGGGVVTVQPGQPPAAGGADGSHAGPPAPQNGSQPGQQPRATATVTARPPAGSTPPPWKSCTYYSGTALTQYGDRNRRVTEVQCILTKRGYSVGSHGVDGNFGPDTLTAVKRFQRDHGLDVDGKVGVDTWAALRGSR